MNQVRLKAYAKVNLTLDVLGRRSDGYHLLNSIMQSISLADDLALHRQERGITIKADHPLVPLDRQNVCWRAAAAFQDYTGIKGGVFIELTKRIPVAAGLGGGSADAAAVLWGLNLLYGAGLSLSELQAIGAQVGADIPFCLQGGTCLVQGIGERVLAAGSFPDALFVLVKIDQGVCTAKVYGELPETTHGGTSTPRLFELLREKQPVPALADPLENALESVTAALVPEVLIWKKRLLAAGARAALMSGSGPTVFGLFDRKQAAEDFEACWQNQVEIMLARPVQRGVVQMNGGSF